MIRTPQTKSANALLTFLLASMTWNWTTCPGKKSLVRRVLFSRLALEAGIKACEENQKTELSISRMIL